MVLPESGGLVEYSRRVPTRGEAVVALRITDIPTETRLTAVTSDGDLVGYVTYQLLGSSVLELGSARVEAPRTPGEVEADIISAVMQHIRRENLKFVVANEAIKSYVDTHPEYADLVFPEPTARLLGYNPQLSKSTIEIWGRKGESDDNPESDNHPEPDTTRQRQSRVGSAAVGLDSANDTSRATEVSQKTRISPLLVATFAVGATVVAAALLSLVLLPLQSDKSRWTPLLVEVLKMAYQALAIGALGGLAKMVIDRRKARDAAEAELRDRRRSYISSIVEASHSVDNARVLVLANRSVKTWSRIINESIVPARTSLRGLGHDLTNWTLSGTPVFADDWAIREEIDGMTGYLWRLIEEHANEHQRLSETQRTAEKQEGKLREATLDEIWNQLGSMTYLADFIRDGAGYRAFREHYFDALELMRKSLASSLESGAHTSRTSKSAPGS